MKFAVFDNFLTHGSDTLPVGNFVACGIAPSSVVDRCRVGQYRVGPRSIVPCSGAMPVVALQKPYMDPLQEGLVNPTDADRAPDETLVLMLFEACDLLTPPGPRLPFTKSVRVPNASIGAAAGSATLALRIPFSGRRQCTIFAARATQFDSGFGGGALVSADLNVLVRGVRYALTDGAIVPTHDPRGAQFHAEAAAFTWFNGGANYPVSAVGTGGNVGETILAAVQHVGGGGDWQESFDELQVWIWGANATDAWIQAEAFGEREE